MAFGKANHGSSNSSSHVKVFSRYVIRSRRPLPNAVERLGSGRGPRCRPPSRSGTIPKPPHLRRSGGVSPGWRSSEKLAPALVHDLAPLARRAVEQVATSKTPGSRVAVPADRLVGCSSILRHLRTAAGRRPRHHQQLMQRRPRLPRSVQQGRSQNRPAATTATRPTRFSSRRARRRRIFAGCVPWRRGKLLPPRVMVSSCLSRLQKEYQRLGKEPVPNVVAEPRWVASASQLATAQGSRPAAAKARSSLPSGQAQQHP